MAPKKRKQTKSQRKKLLQDRGKLGAEIRGIGTSARQDIVLPAQWQTETKAYASHDAFKVISPNKTTYHSMSKVKETLKKRGMDLCLEEDETSVFSEEESEFEPSPRKVQKVNASLQERSKDELEIERQFFVCESNQISALVDQVNKNSRCATKDCNGILVPAKVETVGLGGTITVVFVCNGCMNRSVTFEGSVAVEGSRRTVVGLALAVAFIVTGHGFSKFRKTLNTCLGIPAVSKNRFYEVTQLIYPHIQAIVESMCEEEKTNMKKKDCRELGSWEHAVVTSDGVWLTRGHFSKNGSFIIKNYLTGGLLWFGHKSMRGGEDEWEQLYKGTSKSMEGVLAEECYRQAKDEGCNIEAVWQDGDSSAKKSVVNVFGEEPKRVFKCGGHVGRSHGNNLKDLSKQKTFTNGQVSKWKGQFEELEKLKCHCARHSNNCGCLSEQFIKNARVNHFCCLQQCDSSSEYARRMRALSEHHVKDEHSWEGEKCGFHAETVCSCGKCLQENEFECEEKPYSTKNKLTCAFHQMAYRLECEMRARDADAVIHPEMGCGHSNLCEAHFNLLPHFRAKDLSLCQ